MDFYVYDKNLSIVGIIDNYTSAIWTLRYNDAGDFELYVKSSPALLEMCKIGYYVVRDTDSTVMIIKSIEQAESTENGDYITITGVSIENIIGQRVVWHTTMIFGRAEECIYQLINESMINPIDSNRKINNFSLANLKHLTEQISLTNFTGQNVLDIVKQLCVSCGYGFKITFSDGNLIFEVYSGVDRSQNQSTNQYVIFDAETIAESTYKDDASQYRNVARIGGSGEDLTRKFATYGSAAGVDRFEIFVDASSVSQTDLLQSAGREKLQETTAVKTFDGEISNYYTYGVDYSLGDIVQIENKQGITATARVTEIIQSVDDSGIYTIPTFSEWEVV